MRGRARAAALKGKSNGGAIGCSLHSVAAGGGMKVRANNARRRNSSQLKVQRSGKSSRNSSGIGVRRRGRVRNTTHTSLGNGALKPPAVPQNENIYKDTDYSREGIGNFEDLLPFDKESEQICSDFALAEDDIMMQEKVKLLVASIRTKERLLVRQQREELARRKGPVASEDQVKAAASILGTSEHHQVKTAAV